MQEFDDIVKKYQENFLSSAKEIVENPNSLKFEASSESIKISRITKKGNLSPILNIHGFFNNKLAATKVEEILKKINKHFGDTQIDIAGIKQGIENNGIAKTF